MAEALNKFIERYGEYSEIEISEATEDATRTKEKHEEYLKLRPELADIAESKGMPGHFPSMCTRISPEVFNSALAMAD